MDDQNKVFFSFLDAVEFFYSIDGNEEKDYKSGLKVFASFSYKSRSKKAIRC